VRRPSHRPFPSPGPPVGAPGPSPSPGRKHFIHCGTASTKSFGGWRVRAVPGRVGNNLRRCGEGARIGCRSCDGVRGCVSSHPLIGEFWHAMTGPAAVACPGGAGVAAEWRHETGRPRQAGQRAHNSGHESMPGTHGHQEIRPEGSATPAGDQRKPRRAVSGAPRQAAGGAPARLRAACLRRVSVAGFAGSSGLFIARAFVTMACVRCTKGFTTTIGEICVTVARPPTRRRGGGTPDDRARKPHGAPPPAGR
jgi:hypothetical protein